MAAVHTAIAAELSVQSSKDVYIRHQRNLFSDKNGSSWCFEDSSPLDICLEQKKLLGSAARRQQGWILFHGSLVLQIPTENPDVAELGFEPDLHAVNSRLADALEIDFQAGDWDISEQTLAASIARQKYAADDFLYKR
jgi:lipoate-protein ligase A